MAIAQRVTAQGGTTQAGISLRTISVNAAFLHEIKEDHHELRQLLHHTSTMLEHSGPVEIDHSRLVELLSKLRDQLAMHFSLEEAYGYFEDAVREAPHLNRRAELLRAQHFDLFAEFCRVVDGAEQLLYHERPAAQLAEVAAGYRHFLVRFREHEAQEADLILEAFNDDLGTGD